MGCTQTRPRKKSEPNALNSSKDTVQTQDSSRVKLTPAAYFFSLI